jgi:hypothetical protein
MSLNSAARAITIQAEGNMIPQAYQTAFQLPDPANQPAADPVVPAPQSILNVVDDARGIDDQVDRAVGHMPFICALVCPSMVVIGIILLITNHLKL